MEKIVDVETDDVGNVTGTYMTDDIAEANIFRRAAMAEIETYAIEYVAFDVNTSARYDETLALRFGQLVIDHTQFNIFEDEFKTRLSVTGPAEVTTDDIPNIPFKYRTPIVLLRDGEKLECDLIVRKGTSGNQRHPVTGEVTVGHVKFRPISGFSIQETESGDGFIFKFKNIGMMETNDIIQAAVDKMPAAITRQPDTLYSRQLVPVNM